MVEGKEPLPGTPAESTLAERYRIRAENLMALALETSSSLGLPEFVKNFLKRSAEMMGSGVAVLLLAQGKNFETVAVHGSPQSEDKNTLRKLNGALTALAATSSDSFLHGPAETILDKELARALGWNDVTVAWLTGSDRSLLGVVLLANRNAALTPDDESLLQALAAHAAVALENSRLFNKIAQASRHWHDIFDAISDLIVVHDDGNRVLRVNRSMASLIGTPPQDLIGLNMGALISGLGGPQGCQFCRLKKDGAEEYLHPRARPHVPGLYLGHTGSSQRRSANHSCTEGRHRSSRSRVALPRTVRQHSGRPLLFHSCRPFPRSKQRPGTNARV